MPDLKIYKEIGSVPGVLSSDAIYTVRTGPGFDLYVSDTTGSVAYKINTPSVSPEENNILRMTSGGYSVEIPEAPDISSFITAFTEALAPLSR